MMLHFRLGEGMKNIPAHHGVQLDGRARCGVESLGGKKAGPGGRRRRRRASRGSRNPRPGVVEHPRPPHHGRDRRGVDELVERLDAHAVVAGGERGAGAASPGAAGGTGAGRGAAALLAQGVARGPGAEILESSLAPSGVWQGDERSWRQRLRVKERELAELRARLAEWEGTTRPSGSGTRRSRPSPARRSRRSTRPPTWAPGLGLPEKLGFPGEYPYTRGPYTSMYRTRLWTKRQFAGFGTSRRRTGATSTCSSRGRRGSASRSTSRRSWATTATTRARWARWASAAWRSSLADMETLFDGIPLDQVSVSMTINGPAIMLFCFYVVAAEKQGVAPAAAPRHGPERHPEGVPGAARVDLPARAGAEADRGHVRVGVEHAPKYNPISISGYHIREAGSTAAQELAYTLRNGFEYVERGIERGWTWTTSRPASASSSTCTTTSSRRSPSSARRAASGRATCAMSTARSEESWRLRTHAQTAGVSAGGAAAGEQHRARRLPGHGRGAGRDAVAAHQLHGRDAGAAHGEERADRAADAADPGVRDGRRQHDRPAGRLVLRRERRPTGWRREAEEIFERDRGAGRRGPRHRAGLLPARDRPQRRAAAARDRGGRADRSSGSTSSLGGNDDADIDILRIGDEAARTQDERLAEAAGERDDARVEERR
jgi:methylmalonyl-CoA mutase, N-terminal domain